MSKTEEVVTGMLLEYEFFFYCFGIHVYYDSFSVSLIDLGDISHFFPTYL